MFLGRTSTRELALLSGQMIEAHIKECEKSRALTAAQIADLRSDNDAKHQENRAFQNKLLWGMISILGTTLFKILFDTLHFQVHIG